MKTKRECYKEGQECLEEAEKSLNRSYAARDKEGSDYWRKAFLDWIDITLSWAKNIEGAPE